MLELAVTAVGGAIGSLLRYGVGLWYAKRTPRGDRATLTINLTGSFILGLLIGLGIQEKIPLLYLFAGTGILGGYTTYSTFMVQSVMMAREREYSRLARYLLLTCAGGILLGWAGVIISYSL
ncbi:fluoride efflux transporter FluC [Paenibacillus sp. GCM10012307]|uniref:Fluoride-specific ion channel FluC n=1 Tax=Paenibacillus roseus TaxID=2798579 RepID=A0A934JAH4_9BACL|nr:CrcB family protein [Paenibacillus roseus]MBJ6363253.1 CrcB family protein [Paenibacillus roseus]